MKTLFTDRWLRGLEYDPEDCMHWDTFFSSLKGGTLGLRVSPLGLKSWVLSTASRVDAKGSCARPSWAATRT